MRALTRLIAIPLLLIGLSAVPATAATTLRDLLTLKAAGVGDDILIALFQGDGTIFRLTAQDVLDLRQQGMSDRVILAMLETAKRALVAPPPPASAGSDPAAETLDANPAVGRRQVEPRPEPPPAPPVTVEVTQTVIQEVEQPRERTRYIQVPVPVAVAVPVIREPRRAPEPVYWGYGGQRRPDSWQPPKDPTPPAKPRRGGG